MNKRFAFTLAEVLVTLGIIGVVSAMTIPSLTQSWQKQAYVTQLKKTYSLITQAAALAIQEEGVTNLDESKYTGSEGAKNFFKKYFKIVNDCGTSNTPCLASKYRHIDGSQASLGGFSTITVFTIADGAAIRVFSALSSGFGDSSYTSTDQHGYLSLIIDINGAKGPNVAGRDLFYAVLFSDGKLAESYAHDFSSECPSSDQNYGFGCLTRIMNNGWVMDY